MANEVKRFDFPHRDSPLLVALMMEVDPMGG